MTEWWGSMKSKYHILYKITNTINGKIYIGTHSTYNVFDGYMGSGLHIKRAIKKYGIHNFKREILGYYETRKELSEAEHRIVDASFIDDECTYNIVLGGDGEYAQVALQ